ncbi:V-set and immunoglobulin domain-containing protein 10 isoform X2 [Electrophorus electricus]|uniref:V-set and immunoglobulin domain-containing protein 10 isoform X2 n=1 Tax=Electrophorus electricus TaxID=8005 RepID=UPI0015CFE8BC|nr:V-set and immunoglobulin domain-containing protein 10 isoform X2 [Electrophorus electricus]
MKIFGIVFLYFYLCQSADEQTQRVRTGQVGRSVLLPCLEGPVLTPPLVTIWRKYEMIVVTHNHSQPVSTGHFSVLNDGSLKINGLMTIDQGVYRCETQPDSGPAYGSILLQIAGGLDAVEMDIKPAKSLPNGTLFIHKGTNVSFNCSSKSYPSQSLTWTFEDLINKDDRIAFGNGSSLHFMISNLQPSQQGNYTCRAQNSLSNSTAMKRQELLVYYSPETHPDCSWALISQPNLVHFNCSWYGGYPAPKLQVFLGHRTDGMRTITSLEDTENLEVTLNRTMLYEGQKIKCVAQHIVQRSSEEKSCSFTLTAPYPEGDPLVAALEGSNITLKCSEASSLPPAVTVWQRGEIHESIVPSSKYILAGRGPLYTLTIVNVTKEDEGLYFCWSENALTAKELEVFLTVRSSADNSGAVVGVFISVLIVVAGITLGLLAYSHRDRICLGFRFGRLEEDRTDVMSLVESDEEEVFDETIPRLPPLSNGQVPIPATTLVEIHQIQSSDHEDNVNDTDQADEYQIPPE